MCLLRDLGINAIRLRIWVNPENDTEDVKGWCNKGELENELKGLIQQEREERIAADAEIKESVNELKTLHINDLIFTSDYYK